MSKQPSQEKSTQLLFPLPLMKTCSAKQLKRSLFCPPNLCISCSSGKVPASFGCYLLSDQHIHCPDPRFHIPASCIPGAVSSQHPKKTLTKSGSVWSKFWATGAQMKSSLSRVIHSSHLFKHGHSPRTAWQPSLWAVDSTALPGAVLRQVHITRQWRWTAPFSSGMEKSNC